MQRFLSSPLDSGYKINSALHLLKTAHNAFGDLVSRAYAITDFLCQDYPKRFNWYWQKVVPGCFDGTREIFLCTFGEEITGVAILKKEDTERKICTFLVLERYRGKHVSSFLIENAFDFLGTTKPLITIADYKVDMFKGLIQKYHWQKTQTLGEGYYNNTSREVVFNGTLS